MKGRQLEPTDYEHVFKIVIIGNANVGKTSLLGRYVDGDAPGMNYSATLGVEYKVSEQTRKCAE